jgi:hypothetical protein
VKDGGQRQSDEHILKALIERHFRHTGSERAKALLADWEQARTRFIKVLPTDYKRALGELWEKAQKLVQEIEDLQLDPVRTKEIYTYIEKGKDSSGAQSFDQHITQIYKNGLISLEEAKGNATKPEDFERNLIYDRSQFILCL